MPKGTGRPFNTPERDLAKKKVRSRSFLGSKPLSVANEGNKQRDGLRSMRRTGEKALVATGLAPYIRTGVGKETYPKKKVK